MKVRMHALAASCEELRARTGNPPLAEEKLRIQNTEVITILVDVARKLARQILGMPRRWR